MKNPFVRLLSLPLILLSAVCAQSPAAVRPKARTKHTALGATRRVCKACILSHEEFLASDVMRGRGSATHDEWVAAAYVASELRQYGIEPAGDDGYLQKVPLVLGKAGEEQKHTYTWNAVGILRGRDPALRNSAVLLTAHLDHLGIGAAVNGDDIYNGADDDASGVTAVLELARVLGRRRSPRRTVIFALFGSEEIGGFGAKYFREHPPIPLKDIAANLEFEMIGRPDPMEKADTLWLTGWERSNLGPALAAHGAHLVPDPHAEQKFFTRSDNYTLAKKGVVAQTISSYGLHTDYHQPSDDVRHLDFHHMDAAIESLLRPIEWLVNSRFVPRWKEGGEP